MDLLSRLRKYFLGREEGDPLSETLDGVEREFARAKREVERAYGELERGESGGSAELLEAELRAALEGLVLKEGVEYRRGRIEVEELD